MILGAGVSYILHNAHFSSHSTLLIAYCTLHTSPYSLHAFSCTLLTTYSYTNSAHFKLHQHNVILGTVPESPFTVQEVLHAPLVGDDRVGLQHPLDEAPAVAWDVPVLHILGDIPEQEQWCTLYFYCCLPLSTSLPLLVF